MSPRIEMPEGFLLEANYYRLAYQLAAQRANGAAAVEKVEPQRLEVAATEPPGDELVTAEVALLGERVQRTLDYLAQLVSASALPLRRRLTQKEKRLQRFLLSTVRPSVELILAGMEVKGRPDAAASRVNALFAHSGGAVVEWTGVLLRHARVTIVPWSYRAYYNLACYAAALPGDPWLEQRDVLLRATGRDPGRPPDFEVGVSIWALQQAFRLARDRERRELVRWADQDPSLKSLRDDETSHEQFEDLLARYRPVQQGAAPPAYDIVPWTSADEREDLASEFEDLDADEVDFVSESRLRGLRRAALTELLTDRPGYEVHREAAITTQDPPQRLRVDALLRSLKHDQPDVVVELHALGLRSPRGLIAVAHRAVRNLARYEAMTARAAKLWVIVVTSEPAPSLSMEELLDDELGVLGTSTVLEASDLAALRDLAGPT